MAGRRTAALIAAGLLALAGSNAAGQSTPAAPTPADGADMVVLSRTDNTQVVETNDLRLALTKAGREEHALVRRLIFVSATLRLTEPAAQVGEEPAPQTCRWTFRSFLQRQICFSSMSGLLSCTEQEISPLPDEAHGEAPLPANAPPGSCNDAFRPAVNARVKLGSGLLSRSKELFAADQRAKVDPLFRAAGVTARPEPTGTAAAPGEKRPSARTSP